MSKTTTLRCPTSAAQFLYVEAIRLNRSLVEIVGAAARAFESLPPRKREQFTLPEPMPASDRVKLGLSLGDFNARGQRRENRKRGAR